MVRDGFNEYLGVHDDVSHELSVPLPRVDVVNAFFASSVEGMRYIFLGGSAIVGSESQ